MNRTAVDLSVGIARSMAAEPAMLLLAIGFFIAAVIVRTPRASWLLAVIGVFWLLAGVVEWLR